MADEAGDQFRVSYDELARTVIRCRLGDQEGSDGFPIMARDQVVLY